MTDTTDTTAKSKTLFFRVRIQKAAADEFLNIYSGYDYIQTTSIYLSEEI